MLDDRITSELAMHQPGAVRDRRSIIQATAHLLKSEPLDAAHFRLKEVGLPACDVLDGRVQAAIPDHVEVRHGVHILSAGVPPVGEGAIRHQLVMLVTKLGGSHA